MSRGGPTKSIKNNISFLFFITTPVAETMFLFLFFFSRRILQYRRRALSTRTAPPPTPTTRPAHENVGFE